jgi:hypothetical protein
MPWHFSVSSLFPVVILNHVILPLFLPMFLPMFCVRCVGSSQDRECSVLRRYSTPLPLDHLSALLAPTLIPPSSQPPLLPLPWPDSPYLTYHCFSCPTKPCLASLSSPTLRTPYFPFPCHAIILPLLTFLPCLALPCLALPCLALPCLALPCLALPCLALPCLALPSRYYTSPYLPYLPITLPCLY